MKIQSVNPATEEILHSYDLLSDPTVEHKIEEAYRAHLSWKITSFAERKNLMYQLADVLVSNKEELALLITAEMGKPITPAREEIDKCIWLCHHFADHAADYLAPKFITTEMRTAKVCYNPLGVIFGIMPWNFPYWQVLRFAVPTIMAGNAVLLKHATVTLGVGNSIENLFRQADFPSKLFQHLIVDNQGVARIIEHQMIAAVTLTGSGQAGSSVAAHAGKFLKKSVLELGGSDPYIVLDDADLDLAAQCIVKSRLNNSGQVCIAAKRVIVIKSVETELINRILKYMSSFIMGDPLDPLTQIGPLARKDLRETLHTQIQKSVKQGAKLLQGGIIPKRTGFYYPPTLLTQVVPGMPAFDEELFGPVVVVCSVDNESEAIAYANMGIYGLGAAVFTRDEHKGERIATKDIDAGVCFVNSMVVSDPRLPFGGIKASGYGRELGREGILEFVNIKTIATGWTHDTQRP